MDIKKTVSDLYSRGKTFYKQNVNKPTPVRRSPDSKRMEREQEYLSRLRKTNPRLTKLRNRAVRRRKTYGR